MFSKVFSFKEYKNTDIQDRIINESQADDMYEILAGMDAYVTDYSSACFEAGFAHIPVFIYADDIEKYSSDRGSLFWDIRADNLENISLNKNIFKVLKATLPFAISTNNDELENQIIGFDEELYNKRLDAFHKDIGLVFNGNASCSLADKVEVKII